MVALYFLSVGIVWIFGKSRRSDNEEKPALDFLSVVIVWIIGNSRRSDDEAAPALVRTKFR
jgi:Sec-independent protein secretion pathway component TatC